MKKVTVVVAFFCISERYKSFYSSLWKYFYRKRCYCFDKKMEQSYIKEKRENKYMSKEVEKQENFDLFHPNYSEKLPPKQTSSDFTMRLIKIIGVSVLLNYTGMQIEQLLVQPMILHQQYNGFLINAGLFGASSLYLSSQMLESFKKIYRDFPEDMKKFRKNQ